MAIRVVKRILYYCIFVAVIISVWIWMSLFLNLNSADQGYTLLVNSQRNRFKISVYESIVVKSTTREKEHTIPQNQSHIFWKENIHEIKVQSLSTKTPKGKHNLSPTESVMSTATSLNNIRLKWRLSSNRVRSNHTNGFLESFNLPHLSFRPINIPIVVFSNYRYQYLSMSVESLRNVLHDISRKSPCNFVLHQTAVTTEDQMNRTLDLLKGVDFCKVSIWQYNYSKAKPSAALYKEVWWKVIQRVFSGTAQADPPVKEDVFFLEEDAVLSPDAIKVLWFCLRVKNSFGSNIFQVSLGGYAGENLINAHPDTVVVRKTLYLQPMAYAFNSSFYSLLNNHSESILVGNVPDFSEAISHVLSNPALHLSYHIVVPTLSRMWHVGTVGLGHSGDYKLKRDVDLKPHWVNISRLINLKQAVVNRGIRDVFGFYCKEKDRLNVATFNGNLCRGAGEKFPYTDRRKLVCIEQKYVNDQCMEEIY